MPDPVPVPAPVPVPDPPPVPQTDPTPVEPTGGTSLADVRFGPYLQAPASDRLTVMVETFTSVAVTVELDGRRQTTSAGTHHELSFSGLAPSTRHWYRLIISDQPGVVHHASTLPAPGEPLRFVVMGDHRSQPAMHAEVLEAVAAEGADLLVDTGDLVFSGSREAEWDEYFAVAGPLLAEASLVTAAGNHEVYEDGTARFTQLFSQPPGNALAADLTYSFDAGNTHFVVLNSNQPFATVKAWMLADLTAARAAGAARVFVVVHQGPHSCGLRGGDLEIREMLDAVRAVSPIDAVFAGHDHIYERGEAAGLRYFVSGGGGAALYTCTPLATTKTWAREYHYLVVTVGPGGVRVIAKKPDGTILDDLGF